MLKLTPIPVDAQRQREKVMVQDQCNDMEEDPTDSNSIATGSDQVSVCNATAPELVRGTRG
jgi:hypothetical protein